MNGKSTNKPDKIQHIKEKYGLLDVEALIFIKVNDKAKFTFKELALLIAKLPKTYGSFPQGGESYPLARLIDSIHWLDIVRQATCGRPGYTIIAQHVFSFQVRIIKNIFALDSDFDLPLLCYCKIDCGHEISAKENLEKMRDFIKSGFAKKAAYYVR